MNAEKITVKQSGHQLPVMGKGKYTPVQINTGKQAGNSLPPNFVHKEGIVQLATNYL